MEEISFPKLSLGFGLALVEDLVVGEVALKVDAFFCLHVFPLVSRYLSVFFASQTASNAPAGGKGEHATGTVAWKPNGPQKVHFARDNRTWVRISRFLQIMKE